MCWKCEAAEARQLGLPTRPGYGQPRPTNGKNGYDWGGIPPSRETLSMQQRVDAGRAVLERFGLPTGPRAAMSPTEVMAIGLNPWAYFHQTIPAYALGLHVVAEQGQREADERARAARRAWWNI